MNVNLLSRGGFGYIGASLTSLIYASNFIMYCAFEGMILVAAVHAYFPAIPVWLLIVVFGLLVIPLNWFGIKQLDKLQKWSLPIFFIFLIAAIIVAFNYESVYASNFWTYMPEGVQIGGTALIMYRNATRHYGVNCVNRFRLRAFPKTKRPENRFNRHRFYSADFLFWRMGSWYLVWCYAGEANPGVYIVVLLGLGGCCLQY